MIYWFYNDVLHDIIRGVHDKFKKLNPKKKK